MTANIPVLWCHGTSDDEIPLSYGEEAFAYLRTNLGLPSQIWNFQSYDELGHAIRTDELEDVAEWLVKILS
jgi:predicted esterase